MLSDTLADAIFEIEEYEKNSPECYSGMADEIGVVKIVMDSVRVCLDTPPHETGDDHFVDELLLAVKEIDLSKIIAIRERWLASASQRGTYNPLVDCRPEIYAKIHSMMS